MIIKLIINKLWKKILYTYKPENKKIENNLTEENTEEPLLYTLFRSQFKSVIIIKTNLIFIINIKIILFFFLRKKIKYLYNYPFKLIIKNIDTSLMDSLNALENGNIYVIYNIFFILFWKEKY